jgi:hypothetical protein
VTSCFLRSEIIWIYGILMPSLRYLIGSVPKTLYLGAGSLGVQVNELAFSDATISG